MKQPTAPVSLLTLVLAIGVSFFATTATTASAVGDVVLQDGADQRDGADQADQEEAVDEKTAAKIEKYIGLARTGRVSVRPQAARRLVRLGTPAATRIRDECGEDGRGLAGLGQYLVEVLGEFGDPTLRAHLWRGLEDRDFPWRGPAARTLAATTAVTELAPFLELLNDHLGQVREASISALQRLGAKRHLDAVRPLLEDQNDRVRRAAAALLDHWGEGWALAWLVEDLKRNDRFFRMPLGEQARFDAIRVLQERLGETYGYRAENPPGDPQNRMAIAAIAKAVSERAKGVSVEIPDLAKAGGETEGDLLGLELRSCRRGEFYLRWNRADVLYVGTGNAEELALEQGTVARLHQRFLELAGELGEERYWGAPGCDLEQFHLVNAQGQVESFLVSKGPDPVPDLRPTPLDEVVRLLVETLPDDPSEDPRMSALRTRVKAALKVLGGGL